jgi:hypothetical protein
MESLNIDPEWLRQMADAEDEVGGISIGSIENVVEAENKLKNNFNLRGFRKVSDREIYIELDDGTDITIKALTRYVYDENEGYIDEPYLEIKVD